MKPAGIDPAITNAACKLGIIQIKAFSDKVMNPYGM
jgi:hypothetical protein